MLRIEIKPYGKSVFAQMMFPDIKDPRHAQDKLLRWIKMDAAFHRRLLKLGNSKNANEYTSRQIQLIVDKWGEPGEYDGY